jgi:hypothetical protein
MGPYISTGEGAARSEQGERLRDLGFDRAGADDTAPPVGEGHNPLHSGRASELAPGPAHPKVLSASAHHPIWRHGIDRCRTGSGRTTAPLGHCKHRWELHHELAAAVVLLADHTGRARHDIELERSKRPSKGEVQQLRELRANMAGFSVEGRLADEEEVGRRPGLDQGS